MCRSKWYFLLNLAPQWSQMWVFFICCIFMWTSKLFTSIKFFSHTWHLIWDVLPNSTIWLSHLRLTKLNFLLNFFLHRSHLKGLLFIESSCSFICTFKLTISENFFSHIPQSCLLTLVCFKVMINIFYPQKSHMANNTAKPGTFSGVSFLIVLP